MRHNRLVACAAFIETLYDCLMVICPFLCAVFGYLLGARLLIESYTFARDVWGENWHYHIAGSGVTLGLAYYLGMAFLTWKFLPLPVRLGQVIYNLLADERAAFLARGLHLAVSVSGYLTARSIERAAEMTYSEDHKPTTFFDNSSSPVDRLIDDRCIDDSGNHKSQPRHLILLACAFVGGLCVFHQAQAQSESLAISPAIVEAAVKRGATYDKTFTVSNNTTTRLRVRFSVTDYWYDEHNERVEGRPGTLPRSASLWVQFTPSEIIIEPHASSKVNAVISVPREAAGGYYTMPVVEVEAADKPGVAIGTGGAITATVAVRVRGLMLLTTMDATAYNVEVIRGVVTPPTLSNLLELQLDIRNRSTAHVNARGSFAILDAAGKLAGRGRFDEQRYLPGQRDTLKTSWSGELARGSYTMIVTLSYDRAAMDAATLVYEIPFDVK